MGVMKVHQHWRLRDGIASATNFAVLLAALLTFPLVLRWTGALSVADMDPQGPQHTRAFLKFCFVLTAFSWTYFAIAFVGIKRRGRVTWQEVVGAKWHSWQAIIRDLSIALVTLVTMAVIGNLSNVVLGPLQLDSAAFRSMVEQNTVEALAFLVAALTGGFVEELSSAVTFSDNAGLYVEARFSCPFCKYSSSRKDISTRAGYDWCRFSS